MTDSSLVKLGARVDARMEKFLEIVHGEGWIACPP